MSMICYQEKEVVNMNRSVIMMISTAVKEAACFVYGISVPQIIYHDLGFE